MKNKKDVFQPIFIVGNSRSGTTLMAKILGNTPSIHVFNELHYFENIWSNNESSSLTIDTAKILCAKLLRNIHEGMFSTTPWTRYLHHKTCSLVSSRGNYITGYDVYKSVVSIEVAKHGMSRSCEQTPRYLYYVREILNEYQDARVIVMVRDPRAILLSQKKKWKQKNIGSSDTPLLKKTERFRRWANYHPIVTSLLWRSAIKSGLRIESDPRVMTIQFEKLVSDQVKSIQNICSFLGIIYDEKMHDIAPTLSPTNPVRSNGSPKKGIDPEVADRWKNDLSPTDIYICELINKKYMHKYGYVTTNKQPIFISLFFSLIGFPFKLVLAIILNITKNNNIFYSTWKRISQ